MKKEVKFPLKVKINNNDQPDMTASIYKYELRTNRIFLEFYLYCILVRFSGINWYESVASMLSHSLEFIHSFTN